MKRAFMQSDRSGRTSIVLAIIFLCSTTALFAQDEKAEVGRYQIVSGTTQVISQHDKTVSSSSIPVMIKVDTKTGDTWILMMTFDDKTGGEGWMGLGEYFASQRPKVKSAH